MEKFYLLFHFIFDSPKGLALLALALPLLSFFVLMFCKLNKWINTISISTFILTSFSSLYLLYLNIKSCGFSLHTGWLSVGNINLSIGVQVDLISSLMLSMVSFIALMVVVFSTNYMKSESRYGYFFAYISLFVFSMYGLVLSTNLLWTYIFWEMVGFCSYLLIGFYTQKNAAIFANKKAFIINRIGDLGFLVGLMILVSTLGTLDILELFNRIKEHGIFVSIADKQMLHYAGYAFFIAVIAKSAQFPLHIWLPDAMEGPTPISALIHSATMVIAGVYLLIRIYFLLDPSVLNLIAIIGSFTAFLGAFKASKQVDIKKILAYSTISQLGYMVMAIGVTAPMAAFYHLYTHAFFKAALFLGAGSIIHTLHTQDIREMGGVRKILPITFVVYLISSLALVGVPFFSGFFSKEAILNETIHWSQSHGGVYLLVPVFAFSGLIFTAYYVYRHVRLVFFGEQQTKLTKQKEAIAISLPLLLLSIGSIIMYPLYEEIHELKYMPYITVALISIGFTFGYFLIVKNKAYSFKEIKLFNQDITIIVGNAVVAFAQYVHKFDIKIIDGSVNNVAKASVKFSTLISWFDVKIVDGLVNSIASLTKKFGDVIRRFQTGKVQTYFAISTVLVVLFIWIFMRGI